jgi:hypothetical protein
MSSVIFAYLGPETMLPLTSIVATVAGILLMFGRGAFRIVRRAVPIRLGQAAKSRSVPKPHLRVEAENRPPSTASRT